MSKVLVTGGSGFLGGWIVRTLLEDGYDVVTTVRSTQKGKILTSSLTGKGISTDGLSIAVLDLKSSEGWVDAMSGIDYVIHSASPMGGETGNLNDSSMIDIAKAGVNNVLSAAISAGVKRVVMTSSGAANLPKENAEGIIDETVWSDDRDQSLGNYVLSKIKAEKEAWDIISNQSETELVTILPDAIFGPFFGGRMSGTDRTYMLLLSGMPVPDIYFPICDVRDLARLHVLAMESDKAAGERIHAETADLMMPQLAEYVRKTDASLAERISTEVMTADDIRAAAPANPIMAGFLGSVDIKYRRANKKSAELGWTYHSGEETIRDNIRYLIQNDLIPSAEQLAAMMGQ